MKAVERDAKRADAIKNRPKMTRLAPRPSKVLCYVCGSEMVGIHDARGGICGNCMGKAKAQRDEVARSRATAERLAEYAQHPVVHRDWKPRKRKHAEGYGRRSSAKRHGVTTKSG